MSIGRYSKIWTTEEDEILINFIRNHEAIYDITNKEYRKTKLKQKWWREIGKILNKTDIDCHKRWCYIRDYYVRRRAKSSSCGEAARRRYNLLSFLDNVPSPQRSLTKVTYENPGDLMENSIDNSEQTDDGSLLIENIRNEQTQSNHETEDPGFISCNLKSENTHEIDFVIDENDKKDDKAEINKRIYNVHVQEHLNIFEQIEDPVFRSDNIVNDKKDNKAEINKRLKQTQAQGHQNIIANRNSQSELDENDHFFCSMAKIVKKLPPYEQAQLRLQIGSLVGNAELRHISNSSQIAISPTPSTSYSNCERKPFANDYQNYE